MPMQIIGKLHPNVCIIVSIQKWLYMPCKGKEGKNVLASSTKLIAIGDSMFPIILACKQYMTGTKQRKIALCSMLQRYRTMLIMADQENNLGMNCLDVI